jgi:hypothetical protein
MTMPKTAPAGLHTDLVDYISGARRRKVAQVDGVWQISHPPIGRQRGVSGLSFKRTSLRRRMDTKGDGHQSLVQVRQFCN